MTARAKVGVFSEIGRLRRVLVHAPGPELLAVTPGNRREFLYDDLLSLDIAAEEHRRFVSILKRFSQVLEVRTLLEETLATDEARRFLIQRSKEVTADSGLESVLDDLDPQALARAMIEGREHPPGPFSDKLQRRAHALPPLPNLFFTRDASMVVGDHVVVSAMRFLSRWPEEVVMRTIFGFHPEFAGTPILYDGSNERRREHSLEGGDVHPLNDEVLLVGLSERTTAAALDVLAERLFARTKYQHIVGVVLPDASTAIHLDMVFTQVSRDQCAVHPPLFRGPTRAPVLHLKRGADGAREIDSVFSVLKSLGLPLEPIWCGGESPESQAREQWASGCNFLTLAPGQVLAYARNENTLRAMESAGFEVVRGEDVLLGNVELADDQAAVITFAGSELVRGGGGPRCMSCPVLRDPV